MRHRTIKALIDKGLTDGAAEKVGVFYAAGKLTDEQYGALTGLLGGDAA